LSDWEYSNKAAGKKGNENYQYDLFCGHVLFLPEEYILSWLRQRWRLRQKSFLTTIDKELWKFNDSMAFLLPVMMH
jgi:hypothetical protein